MYQVEKKSIILHLYYQNLAPLCTDVKIEKVCLFLFFLNGAGWLRAESGQALVLDKARTLPHHTLAIAPLSCNLRLINFKTSQIFRLSH